MFEKAVGTRRASASCSVCGAALELSLTPSDSLAGLGGCNAPLKMQQRVEEEYVKEQRVTLCVLTRNAPNGHEWMMGETNRWL